MAAALGSTTDPKALIPGDVETLTDLAGTMTRWSEKFDKVGSNLRDLRVPGWHGEAGDAFLRSLSEEKGNWYTASDHLSGAATAITSYSGVLGWAQGQAADAIAKWENEDRTGAQEVLDHARTQLESASTTLSAELGKLAGGAADSPSWLTRAKQVIEDLGIGDTRFGNDGIRPYGNNPADQHTRQWGHQGGNAGDDPDAPRKPSWAVKIAGVSGGADVWSANARGETTVGGVKLSGETGVSLLGVDGSAFAGITDGNLELKATGNAYLAKATASGSAEYGIIGFQGQGSARAGVNAETKVAAGKDGLNTGAEAFAGAKAQGSASADVGGIGAGVTGEAWAGAGASATMDLGKGDDGKYHIGGEVGVGLGIGAKVGFQFTVDTDEVIDTVSDAAGAIGSAAESVWNHSLGALF
ncbi:putative T7SS-secreted protein [Streptomyces nodosus]|uniref:putative T7SS-secreted protein n=1 Tax=Streptomyces nodosus TaxID=40318 RepID=UPI003810933A